MERVPEQKIHSRKVLLQLVDIEEPLEEPVINICHPVDLLNSISAMESVGNGKDPLISWFDKFFIDIIHIFVLLKRQLLTTFKDQRQTLLNPIN